MRTILLVALLLLLFCPISLASDINSTDSSNLNDIRNDIKNLYNQNQELKGEIDKLNKDELITVLTQKENSLIQTSDDLMKKINSLTSISVILITVMVGIGTIGVPMLMFVLERGKFNKLEKDFEELKRSKDDYISTKNDLEKTIKDFNNIKTDVVDMTTQIAITRDFVASQTNETETRFDQMKNSLEEIRKQVEESADNAKKSEIKTKSSEYSNKGILSKDPDDQITQFTKAIELDPYDPVHYYNRGIAYKDKIDYANALKDFNKCIELDPNDSDCYYNRALIYDLIGDLDNELKDLNKGLELCPTDTDFHNSISMYYRKVHNLDLAEHYIYMGLKINKDNSFLYSTLAEIMAEKGDKESFYSNLEKSYELGCPVWDFIDSDPIYNQFKNETRFIQLLEKYKNNC